MDLKILELDFVYVKDTKMNEFLHKMLQSQAPKLVRLILGFGNIYISKIILLGDSELNYYGFGSVTKFLN